MYTLGIFTDFFNWLSGLWEMVSGLLVNTFNGLFSLFNFAWKSTGLIFQISAYFPSVISVCLIAGASVGIVLFVLGR